ncbi:MAG: glycosyltransferase [Planctomycetota bacterium]|jgi:glycosyltransferase involved in cell wall biosynthesis
MTRAGDFHVVVFTDTFFETNGVGSYYKTLLNWCRRVDGMRVTVICPARDDVIIGKIPDSVIPVRPRGQFRNPFYKDLTLGYYSLGKLRAIVEDLTGPKVIHIATSGPLGVAGARVARRMNLASVGCYHTDLQKCARLYGLSAFGRPGAWIGDKVGRYFDRHAYGRCRAICVPTESAADTPAGYFQGEIAVLPNPIDLGHFRPAATRTGAFREKYNHDDKVLAVVVGRVAREKNLDLVCEYLCRDGRINVVFVGDGPYSGHLRRRWNATVTGFLEGDDLRAAYQQADVFVQLSVAETFGLTLVEAMASGLPAVVLRSRGFAGLIPAGNGVDVIEEHELPALADQCVALVTDEERHTEFSRRARAFVQKLSTTSVLPRFMEFHRSFAR